MSYTKNLQTDQALELLVARAFDGAKIKSHHELTEGFCNAAYLVELENGKRVVLKIAPANLDNLMSYEINMMQAEVAAMNLVSEKTRVLLPKVLYHDQTKILCDSEYFFMDWKIGRASCRERV